MHSFPSPFLVQTVRLCALCEFAKFASSFFYISILNTTARTRSDALDAAHFPSAENKTPRAKRTAHNNGKSSSSPRQAPPRRVTCNLRLVCGAVRQRSKSCHSQARRVLLHQKSEIVHLYCFTIEKKLRLPRGDKIYTRFFLVVVPFRVYPRAGMALGPRST